MASLADFSEIFRDADDAYPFLGDPVWWSEFSQIETDRLKDRKSREYRNVMLILFEIFFFSVVVTLFVPLMSFVSQSSQVRFTEQTHREFWSLNSASLKTSDSFWDWADLTLVPSLFETGSTVPAVSDASGGITASFSNNSFPFTSTPVIVPETDMVLVGAVRLRQLRVPSGGCASDFPFTSVSSLCQPDFAADSTESRSGFAKSGCPSYLKSGFLWSETTGAQLFGERTGLAYPSSGYSVLLPPTKAQAAQTISDLHQWEWLDAQTAAVVVEVTSYHPSSNFLAFDRFLFEFPSAGALFAQHSVFAVPAISLTGGQSLLALDILNLISFSACTVLFLLLAVKAGARIVRSSWTWLDVLIIVLLWVYVGRRSELYSVKPSDTFGASESFADIAGVVPLFKQTLELQSVIFLLLVLRAFKFTLVVGRCIPELLRSILRIAIGVGLVALIAIMGFGLAYHVAVGFTNQRFALKADSLAAAAVSLIGVVWAAAETDGIGAFLMTMYIWVVYLVLLPVLLAMTIRASKAGEAGEGVANAQTGNALWIAIKCTIEMVRGKTEVEMVEMGNGVSVSDLPEVVKNRLYVRRRLVHARVEDTFAFSPEGYAELNDFIHKKELTRLLAEDPFVAKVLGSSDAGDVIRMIRSDEQPIQRLQAAVDKKIKVLQKSDIDLHLSVDPAVDAMSKDVERSIAKAEEKVKVDVAALQQATRDVTELVIKMNAQFDKLRKRRTSQSSASSSAGRK